MSKMFKVFLALLAITVGLLGIIGGCETSQRVKYPVAYSDIIVKHARENNLDPFLVMAVVKVESNFVPEAHSDYAGGLMQLTPDTAKWIAADMNYNQEYHYMDPNTNIKFGCYYLKHLIDIYHNIDTALAAYNGGMGSVNEWLKNPDYSDDGITLKYIPYPETENYVKKVNDSWEYYKKLQADN